MKHTQTAFCTVVYPNNLKYFKDFFKSISSQTNKNFDLIILNDNINGLSDILKNYSVYNYTELKNCGNPVKNREYIFNYVIKNGYDYAIFGDSDDYFEPNRVEVIVKLFSEYNCDILVNDIDIVSSKNRIIKTGYLSSRYKNLQKLSIKDIKEKNIFGLSNTALKLSNISTINLDTELIAVDWFIFSTLLLSDCTALFTNQTKTYYKQHQHNTIGFDTLSIERLKKIIAVKKTHYRLMSKKNNAYVDLLTKINNISKLEPIIERYTNKKPPCQLLWWEF